ncbi:MAG: hypothetical protein CVU48_10425 [Candidatus Cloacimonetes bacterium HGW-Cloacimonetes-1]|nr:MAG: hypothetical protein CVU48_10425 [Candidatus Cloacimonetes bacterium HGW-Cloacimonetes-1]
MVGLRVKQWSLLLIILTMASMMCAKISVSAGVDKPRVGLGDQIRYTVTVSSDKIVAMREPSVPKVTGLLFQTVFTTSMTSVSSINFRTVKQIDRSFTYIFIATKQGNITIPEFDIQVEDSSYRVDPVSIEVVAANTSPPQTPRSRGNVYDPWGYDEPSHWDKPQFSTGSTFLYAIPEKSTVYLGEPIVVSYYLYTNQAVTSLNLTDEKDYEGYGKEIYEQPSTLDFQNVKYQGSYYKRSLIKRIALSPNNVGKIKAPTLSGLVKMYDFTTRTMDIASQDLNFDVLPLPRNGRPEDFSGAIGSFTVSGYLDTKDISLGDAFNYVLQISGKGNYNQFTAPLFAASTNFQISEPVITDNLNAGTEGKRTIYYTIIPQEKGSFELPELEFNWFDASAGVYRSFRSKREHLVIRPANVFSYFTNFFARDRQTQIQDLIPHDSYRTDTIFMRQAWYWIVVLIITLALLYSAYLAWGNRLQFRDPIKYNNLQAERILKKYLRDAGTAAQKQSGEFYPLAERGLMRYLSQKYHIPMHLPIKDKLELLLSKSVGDELLGSLTAFLDQCQRVRYMPGAFEPSSIEHDMQNLIAIIKGFDSLSGSGGKP